MAKELACRAFQQRQTPAAPGASDSGLPSFPLSSGLAVGGEPSRVPPSVVQKEQNPEAPGVRAAVSDGEGGDNSDEGDGDAGMVIDDE